MSEGTTYKVIGMTLEVIADLPDEYKLCAHPNGPCIAGDGYLTVLDQVALDDSRFSEEVKRAAIKAYRDLTWKLVKTQFRFYP